MRLVSTSSVAAAALLIVALSASLSHASFFLPQEVAYTSTTNLVYSTTAGSNSYRFATPTSPIGKGEAVAITVDRNAEAAGWDFIRFTADTTFLGKDQAEAYYAAGYAEGFLTYDSIYSSYITAMSEDGDPWLNTQLNNAAGQQWVSTHVAFMRNIGATNTSRYGVMVKSLLRQIDGLYDGYTAALKNATLNGSDPAQPLTWTEMFYVSFQSEMSRAAAGAAAIFQSGSASGAASDEAITQMFPNLAPIMMKSSKRRARGTHCSALVRPTGDDIFFAHDTWSSYNTMVRQYKTYALAGTVTMSGYPGSLSSIDDWYMTSAKLAVTETSIDLETDALNSLVVPQSVSEFMRVMIANYLATTAPEWATLFADHNSGTYNNQYMILDTNLAAARLSNQTGVYNTLDPDTFWVLEQSPGLVVKADQTQFLNEHHYWPSYNIPFYEQIYNRSGFLAAAAVTYSLNNYTTYARARLFKRLYSNVTDLGGMYALMRYNNYLQDDESLIPWCINGQYTCTVNRSSMLSIASRGDLAPLDVNEGPDSASGQPLAEAVTRMNLGAIDTKITSVNMMQREGNAGVAINGPTSLTLPPFNTTLFIETNGAAAGSNNILEGVRWRGVPTYFAFPPAKFLQEVELPTGSPTMAPTSAPDDKGDDSKSRVGIAVGVVAGVGVVGAGGIFAYRKFSRSKYELHDSEESPLV